MVESAFRLAWREEGASRVSSLLVSLLARWLRSQRSRGGVSKSHQQETGLLGRLWRHLVRSRRASFAPGGAVGSAPT